MQRSVKLYFAPQALKDDVARGREVAAGQKRVVYQLQLLGCTFRRALRKSGKRIIARLSSAADRSPSEAEERSAAAAICDLLEATDAAILTIRKVRGPALTLPKEHRHIWRCDQRLTQAIRKMGVRCQWGIVCTFRHCIWPTDARSTPARCAMHVACVGSCASSEEA